MSLNEIGYLVLIIFEVLVLAATAGYAVLLVYSWLMGAPYVATSTKEIDKILKSIQIKKNMTFLELGCGDGRVVIEAVKKYDLHGVGVDVNPWLLILGRIKSKIAGLNTIKFINKNIADYDIPDIDVVYIYLFPELISLIKDKIINLKKGTLVISHAFEIDYLEKNIYKTVNGEKFDTFIYKIK